MFTSRTHRPMAAIFIIGRILMSLGISLGAGAYLFAEPVFTFAAQQTQSVQQVTQTKQTVPVHPIEVDIPSIKKSIPLIKVGLTNTGNMDVPHNYVQAGWYMNGPVPGEVGSAVIDGHVDNGGLSPTIAGVFKKLDNVTAGDIITVKLSDGTSAKFKVTASNVYAYNAFPSGIVFNQNGGSYIKIITCHGTWLPGAKTYNQRLVVTAELV